MRLPISIRKRRQSYDDSVDRMPSLSRFDHPEPTSCFLCGGAIEPLQERILKLVALVAILSGGFLLAQFTCLGQLRMGSKRSQILSSSSSESC